MITAVAFTMMCHVRLPPRLEHFDNIMAMWTGTIGARPVSCCLATVLFPSPIPADRIVGRCQVTHFHGRRRLAVFNRAGVIGGSICRQRHAGCCKLIGVALPAPASFPNKMMGTYQCPHESGLFALSSE